LPLCFAISSHGGEAPNFDVSADQTITVYTATPESSDLPDFRPHINFPVLNQRANGSLLLWWSVGQTHSSASFGLGAESFDGGQTWETPTNTYPYMPVMARIKPAGQQSLGFDINVPDQAPFTSFSQGRHVSTDGGRLWSASVKSSYDTGGVQYRNLYQNSGAVLDVNSTLFLPAYGQRPDVDTFESVLFASTDNGLNWSRRSTIAKHVIGTNTSMGPEGPNETNIIQLDNGNLMAVYRTGQTFPNDDINAVTPSIFRSLSTDGGFTWSDPKMLGVAGSYPHLNKLADGSIAMTYGRYGGKVMFADPTGERWTTPTVIHDGPGSGHVRMHERADGKYVFAYDQSSFFPPSNNHAPPPGYIFADEQEAHMKVTILDIQRHDVPEAYNWAFEYHGDVTPDAATYGWSPQSRGNVSAYLWADLGQDYMRIDTGASGADNSLHYTLDGTAPDSAWAPISFTQGAVIETRARIGDADTAPSSASIFLADGDSGYIMIELTGDGVALEGLGGNTDQVNYTTNDHPGFSTLDWHTYRLVISPTEATGAILAQLYLDDLDQPILEQWLMSSDANLLSFGDLTSTNNGILDVDFLRFATIPEPASLAILALSLLTAISPRTSRKR